MNGASLLFIGLFLLKYGNTTLTSNDNEDPCFYNSTKPVGNITQCLESVKLGAADSRKFWFGERWVTTCSGPRKSDFLRCYNPWKFQKYGSLGSRILRVPTFDMGYLRNLEIFPEITFHSSKGSYKACDHVYRSEENEAVYGRPQLDSIPPWHLRNEPKITWKNLSADNFYYTIVILDVGFGYLHYLAYNFPRKTTVVREYSGPLNYREQRNPYAVVVFRQPKGFLQGISWERALEEDSTYNLQSFMLTNGFQQSLVGLNWLNVGPDAYAIEQQRIRNLVDNCPSLVLALEETVDTWMRVTYDSPETHFTVCCRTYHYESAEIVLDPIGDLTVKPVYTRLPPTISVSTIVQPYVPTYKRTGRDYVALMDRSLYTLLAVGPDAVSGSEGTPSSPLALWLVTNVPGNFLEELSGSSGGTTMLEYLSPLPEEGRPQRIVFLLFRQDDGPIQNYNSSYFSPSSCSSSLRGRCLYDVRELMARYSLKLKAISWLTSKFDEYVLYKRANRERNSEELVCSRHKRKFETNCKPVAEYFTTSSASWLGATSSYSSPFLFSLSVMCLLLNLNSAVLS